MTHPLPADHESGPFTISTQAAKILPPGSADKMAAKRGFDLWCRITDWFHCGASFTTEDVARRAMIRYNLAHRTAYDLAKIVLLSVAQQEQDPDEPPALRQLSANTWIL